MNIPIITEILAANDAAAGENRLLFDEHRLYVFNLMSSPGAGKTTLLERTISAMPGHRIGVIEGDITTAADALRIEAAGAPVVQINTGGGCHLDAGMVRQGADALPLSELDILIVENVGNLVCPAEFTVGEDDKIMVLSVTEGDDKPLKYPLMFTESSLLLVNKTDLLPYTDFDMEKVRRDVRSLNPDIDIIELSCRSGEGLDAWTGWLGSRSGKQRATGEERSACLTS